ncbi:MAG TPA: deoxyribonuclease II family protein, partial [Prosthecobacter sp.]|nr:deoxyribonuclease II family protein [Prosthecobacter sp.]
ASNSGFWLIHSTPKFILPEQFVFPATGMEMAQTFLCVSLPDAATALKIAQQMYTCQQPNVYAASSLPKALEGQAQDCRVLLMNDKISPEPKSDDLMRIILPFTSRGGQKFQAIAKNKHFGQDQKPKLDFYNDLVAPALGANLDVETWEHDPTPNPTDKFSTHKVVGMRSVNLGRLGSKISWSEENDHGKLAISAPTEKVHWVCVGDINFTLAQENRGGGTLAFVCDPLWQELNAILSTTAEPGAKQPAAPKK